MSEESDPIHENCYDAKVVKMSQIDYNTAQELYDAYKKMDEAYCTISNTMRQLGGHI